MRKLAFLILLCMSFFHLGFTQDRPDMEKGHVRVKLTEAASKRIESKSIKYSSKGIAVTSISVLDKLNSKFGVYRMERTFPKDPRFESRHQKHGLHLWYDLYFDKSVQSTDVLSNFSKEKEIIIVEPALEKKLIPYKLTPYEGNKNNVKGDLPFNDPMLADQWHYNNTGQTGGTPGADIRLFDAWNSTYGLPKVIVSIHDQGVDVSHKDIAANLWVNQLEANGTPGIDDDGNGFIDDINGFNFRSNSGKIDAEEHGTHVAGTVAAVNNNGIGVCGVAGGSGNGDGARIMSCEILGGANTARSYVYAADNGSVISQNSWGYVSEGSYEQSVYEAIKYFIAEAGNYSGSPMKGGVVIFASGNSNLSGSYYPSAWDEVIAVSALDPFDKKTSYSNFDTWVDISAPGGESNYGYRSSVLSLVPRDKYAYMDGTSMACPHVSGVAALSVSANAGPNFTNANLIQTLLTSFRPIDQNNPDYIGMLGTGAIDASMATKKNLGIGPDAVTDLVLTGIAQDFATLSWTAIADEDDEYTEYYFVYYSEQPIALDRLLDASSVKIIARHKAGDAMQYELSNLKPLTNYYFAVVAYDRWNNIGQLSNVVSGRTNAGPKISFGKDELVYTFNTSQVTVQSDNMPLVNTDEGLLRWTATPRAVDFQAAWSFSSAVTYPVLNKPYQSKISLGKVPVERNKKDSILKGFTPTNIDYVDPWSSVFMLGDQDTAITNSSAQKFVVESPEGFNLTHVSMYIGHINRTGPIILEIYKNDISSDNLIYVDEVQSNYEGYYEHYIKLKSQFYFKQNEKFWVVFHIPSGNKFPIGCGTEIMPEYSQYSMISFNLGKTWIPLEQALNDDRYTWTTIAFSNNKYLGEYITLKPSIGEVPGNSTSSMEVVVDASKLINGSYESNIVVRSNDPSKPLATFPVKVDVYGQKPQLYSRAIVDFDNVFRGSSRTLKIQMRNIGYGNMRGIVASVDNPEFSISEEVQSVLLAQEDMWVYVTYKPTLIGNSNGVLTISDEDGYIYKVNLSGIASLPSEITLLPESSTFDNLTMKDTLSGIFKIKNTGNYPLQYFIPSKTDNSGLFDYNERIHKFGYTYTKTYDNFDYQDISATGVKISEFFYDVRNYFYPIEIGFNFPFYNELKTKINITAYGVLSFQNNSTFAQSPGELSNEYTPSGFIAATYYPYYLKTGGDIYYKKESDKLIVQYHVFDEWELFTPIEFQIVLHDNGDIEYKYKDFGPLDNWSLSWYFAAIEDENKSDGLALSEMLNCTYTLDAPWKFLIKYPGRHTIDSITNVKGTLAPNEEVEVKYFVKTDSLKIGSHFNSINIISNDPVTPQKQFTFNLNILNGGTKDFVITKDTLNFGKVYQNDIKVLSFKTLNNGTESVNVNSVVSSNVNAFSFEGPQNYIQKVGLAQNFDVSIKTALVGIIDERITFTTDDGLVKEIVIVAEIVPAPAIEISKTSISANILARTNTHNDELVIKNIGASPLTYSYDSYDWIKILPKNQQSTVLGDVFYKWKANINDQYLTDDPNYNWIDIGATGQAHYDDLENGSEYWKSVDLPFDFEFYGVKYSKLYISVAGYISFAPQQELEIIGQFFPDMKEPNNIIAPAMGGMIANSTPYETRMNVYTQSFNDYYVIQYNNMKDRFGASLFNDIQILLYKTGEIKFLYRFNNISIVSEFTSVGIENQTGTDGCLVSAYQSFLQNKSVVCFSPILKRVLNPGESDTLSVSFDGLLLNSGTYNSSITVESDAPGNQKIEIPVSLTVQGQSAITVDGSLDFATVKAYQVLGFNGAEYVTYSKVVEVKNMGSEMVTLTDIVIDDLSELKIEKSVYESWQDSYSWYELYDGEVIDLQPGDKQMFRITLIPTGALSAINTNFRFSSVENYVIPVTASIIEPSIISTNVNEVTASANNLNDVVSRSFSINNDGKSDLSFGLSLKYDRDKLSSKSMSLSRTNSSVSPNLQQLLLDSRSVAPKGIEEQFNRTLQYENFDQPSRFLGFGVSVNFISLTGFTAPEDGFNLSHVSTWYRWDSNLENKIVVDILSGSTPDDATLIHTQEFSFDRESSDKGELITFELSTPIQFLSNERFWVAFTYPLGVPYPQGTVDLASSVSSTFYYLGNDGWGDITQAGVDYSKCGWMVRAHEKEFVESGWLTLSPSEGTVAAGQSTSISAVFKAAGAVRGINNADITITSNDPLSPEKKLKAIFNVNDAPVFSSYPTDNLSVNESEMLAFNITANDPEGNNFDLTVKEQANFVTVNREGNTFNLSYTPDYNSSGINNIVLEVTDEFQASSTFTIPVTVVNVNRAPVVVNPLTDRGLASNDIPLISLLSVFSDPDGDALTYTVSSSNESVIKVYLGTDAIIFTTVSAGKATITVTAKDTEGLIVSTLFDITVWPTAIDESLNGRIKVYPNPTSGNTYVVIPNHNDVCTVRILNIYGSIIYERNTNSLELLPVDMSSFLEGVYFVNLIGPKFNSTVKVVRN